MEYLIEFSKILTKTFSISDLAINIFGKLSL